MTKQEFNEMIEKILSQGIEVTMQMDKDTSTIWYNLNTQMKSDLEIAYDSAEQNCVFKGRYGHSGVIENYDQLLDEVRDCQHGRDFGNETWFKVLENR